MPATIAVREVHPELPPDQAWQQGRRLYVRCSAASRLNAALRGRGAQWDPYSGALWLSTRHREQFTALALEHHRIRTRLEEIRGAGLWVALPYGTDLIRARVKELGGIFDGETRRWAMPTPTALVEIEDLVAVWTRARQAERAAAEQRRRAAWEIERRRRDLEAAERRREALLDSAGSRDAERREAAARADTFRAELARTAGRILLGALETRREVYPRGTNGEAARAAAPAAGTVLRLEDGRRAMVWACTVRWMPAEDAPGYGVDRAHWYTEYRLSLVAPTEDELDTETARAAKSMDAGELHALAVDAALLTWPQPAGRLARIPEAVATIEVTTGVNGLVPAGRLVLDAAGAVWWQHPGRSPDYEPVQGSSTDPDLAARMLAAAAGGPRRCTLPPADAGPPLHYEVTVHDRTV